MNNQYENFEREKPRNIAGYVHKLIDDGWTIPSADESGSGVIEELIEEIELRISQSYTYAMNQVRREHRKHQGKWLNKEAVELYTMKAMLYRAAEHNQYKGRLRKLCEEFRQEYGLTELESINILAGYNVNDYLNKYNRMEHLIPNYESEEEICRQVLEEKAYAV